MSHLPALVCKLCPTKIVLSDTNMSLEAFEKEIKALEEEAAELQVEFPLCEKCQEGKLTVLREGIEQTKRNTAQINERSKQIKEQLEQLNEAEEMEKLKQEEQKLTEELERIEAQVEEARQLKKEFEETEVVLDFLENRCWELRNEHVLELQTHSEGIHHLESKINHMQKHIELLKTANPLCDAFHIVPEKLTINGLKLSSSAPDKRDSNAALGMCVFLLHLLKRKFGVGGIRTIPLGSYSWIESDEPTPDSRGAPTTSFQKKTFPLFVDEKTDQKQLDEGLTRFIKALDDLSRNCATLGFRKPVTKFEQTELQESKNTKSTITWKKIDHWGKDLLIWLQQLTQWASQN